MEREKKFVGSVKRIQTDICVIDNGVKPHMMVNFEHKIILYRYVKFNVL